MTTMLEGYISSISNVMEELTVIQTKDNQCQKSCRDLNLIPNPKSEPSLGEGDSAVVDTETNSTDDITPTDWVEDNSVLGDAPHCWSEALTDEPHCPEHWVRSLCIANGQCTDCLD